MKTQVNRCYTHQWSNSFCPALFVRALLRMFVVGGALLVYGYSMANDRLIYGERLVDYVVFTFRSYSDYEYRSTVFVNGVVEYEGFEDVRTKGIVRYQLSKKQFAILSQRLADVRINVAKLTLACVTGGPIGKIVVYGKGKVQDITLCSRSSPDDLLPAAELFRDVRVILGYEKIRALHGIEWVILRHFRALAACMLELSVVGIPRRAVHRLGAE